MRSAVLSSSLAAALFVSAAAAGAADPPPVGARLEYLRGPGAENCPGEEGLRDAVAAQMGGADPFTKAASKRVVVKITRAGRVYQGEFALYDDGGTLVGSQPVAGTSSCDALIQDLALSLSLTLRPFLLPSPAPSAPAPPALALPPPPPSPPPPPAGTRPLVRIGAAALVGLGSSPSIATPGFGGFLGVRWSWLSLTLEGRGDAHASASDPTQGATVRTSFVAGSFAACLHRSWLLGGGLVTVGRMSGTGANVAPADQMGTYVGLGPRLGAEVTFAEHFAGQLTGDLLFAAARPRVRVDYDAVWTAPVASGVIGLRFLVSF